MNLWPDEFGWPMDIGAVAILDGTRLTDPYGRFKIEVAREAIARRLHLVPRFRQQLYTPRRGLGGPLWVDAQCLDLAASGSSGFPSGGRGGAAARSRAVAGAPFRPLPAIVGDVVPAWAVASARGSVHQDASHCCRRGDRRGPARRAPRSAAASARRAGDTVDSGADSVWPGASAGQHSPPCPHSQTRV